MNIITKLWKEEEGQTLSEYGLIIGLVAAVVVAAVALLSTGISDVFTNIKDKLVGAI
ncbi:MULTISPECIES: Flp family type IVb pilin [Neobacillus]|uniref:Flp family type IVb pilin n=1 Tax=Neobacillus rhizophilus TaxID=2833579 RepID=A0A942U5K3_9BACI|nr:MULTISPECIES: Flp family type IVb pilin [Neobacillus]MBS4213277.1 Flp family type IVb pilin [Neobacillus rhizophilus]